MGKNLDKNDLRYEHHVLEALWVTWGLNDINEDLLKQMLNAKDFRARAAAVKVLRYAGHQVENQVELLKIAANDDNARVRLETIAASSWLDKETGLDILDEVVKKPLDDWMLQPFEATIAHFNQSSLKEWKKNAKTIDDSGLATNLKGEERELFIKGSGIYEREGFCVTCHQPDGKGLSASQFPPLAGVPWVTGDEERLIKLTLNGLMGPIEVLGKKYPGQVPMTPFGGMLNDEEMAAVLTYVRNSFGNNASAISPDKVKEVRDKIKDKEGFYLAEELLKEHPMK